MLKKAFAIISCLLIVLFTRAQKNDKPLSVGDKIPRVEMSALINFKSPTINTSDYKGKLLILDFWATWCAPCISAFPKLDSLQRMFKSQLEILPITYESERHVKNFMNGLKSIKGTSFRTVTEDTVLHKIFSHVSLPHYVWINADGKVIAITSGKEVTESNIQSAIKNGELKVKLKDETARVVGHPTFVPSIQVKTAEIIKIQQLSPSELISHSTLTRYIPGLSPGMTFTDSTYIMLANKTIKSLYITALFGNALGTINANIVSVEIPDSSLSYLVNGKNPTLIDTVFEESVWKRQQRYSYEIKVPSTLARQRFQLMLNELNNYFGSLYGIEGVVEKRNRKCLALVSISDTISIMSKGGKPGVSENRFYLKVQNSRINYLIAHLIKPLQLYPPIVDETNLTQKIDIELKCDLTNLSSVNLELKKYGLQLIEKEKEMNTPVIRMKKDVVSK